MELYRRPVRRILVIAREHLGDLANTTAYLLALQKHFPNATLTVDVGRTAAPVLDNFPGIHQLWLRDKHEGLTGKIGYVSRLRRGRFDLAVIMDDSSRFVLEAWLAWIPRRYGICRKRFANLFTGFIPYSREKHDVFDHFTPLLALLGIQVENPHPVLFPDADDVRAVEELAAEIGLVEGPSIGLNPATVRPYNRWLPERWAALSDSLRERGLKTVLVGPPSAREEHAAIGALSRIPIADLTGRTSVLQLAELCRRMTAVVSVDTGTAHFAAAVDTPVVALYGITDPVRFRPYGERVAVVRPESKSMDGIEVAHVESALASLLKL